GYVFSPSSIDFSAAANLNFTATAIGCGAFAPRPITVAQTRTGTLTNTDCQAPELGNSSGRFTDRFSFPGIAGQAIAITATSTAFTPYIFLIRGADGSQVTSTFGSQFFARIPSGDDFFVLPATDTYFIDVTSTAVNVTGAYSVTLSDVSTVYGGTGWVQTGGVGLGGVTVTFTKVAGSGALPGVVMSSAAGLFSQGGFAGGTVYRATPSLPGYVFNPPSLDFEAPANLNFTATAIGCGAFAPTPITVGQMLN